MKKTILFALWGGLYVLCAGLGFIPAPEGFAKGALTVLAIIFYIPPLMLIHLASGQKDRNTLKLIRNLSALWLLLTFGLLISNFMSVLASETVGNILYSLLVIVSSPMICGQYWALSLFLWAYLMFAAMAGLKKK